MLNAFTLREHWQAGTRRRARSRNCQYVGRTIDNVVVSAVTANMGTVNLELGGTISGTMESSDPSIPAGNLIVSLYLASQGPDQGGLPITSVPTDVNGNFQFTNVAPGTYTVSMIDPSSLETNPTVTVMLRQNATGTNIVIIPGGTITGQAMDSASGSPLANVIVTATNSGGDVATTTTNASGNFQFTGLLADIYEIQLQSACVNTAQTVTVTSDDAVNGTVLNASLSYVFSAALEGTVMDGQGNPLADATLVLTQNGQPVNYLTTDASGNYLFYIVQPGTFGGYLGASFATVSNIQVSAGGTTVQNFSAGTGSLEVNVTDSAQAVSGDSVQLNVVNDGNYLIAGLATLSSTEEATFNNLIGGTYHVQVQGANNDGGSTTIYVADGAAAQTTVNLVSQASLSGVIDDGNGSPLSSATIQLLSTTDSTLQYTATSNPHGTDSVGNIVPGTYDVTASRPAIRR